jgi:cytochrome c2
METLHLRLPVPLFITLVLLLMSGACASKPPAIPFTDLPAGDANSGEKLFLQSINDAPACASCHDLTHEKLTGPGLQGISQRAGGRVEDQSAAEYIYLSIVRPSRYIVRGFSNRMYTDYEGKLEPQDIADLIAFLLTQ